MLNFQTYTEDGVEYIRTGFGLFTRSDLSHLNVYTWDDIQKPFKKRRGAGVVNDPNDYEYLQGVSMTSYRTELIKAGV